MQKWTYAALKTYKYPTYIPDADCLYTQDPITKQCNVKVQKGSWIQEPTSLFGGFLAKKFTIKFCFDYIAAFMSFCYN